MVPGKAPTLRDVFQWEVHSWSRALACWERHLPPGRPVRALAIGEREGGLSLWLASKGCQVTCTDLHPFPDGTRALHLRYGVEGSITYARADATELPFGDGQFDVVIFKSVIGALGSKERQAVAVREMHRVLRPRGVLLFAENLHGSPMHGLLRKRFVRWEGYWRYLDADDDRDLFASFPRLEDHTTGFLANLGRTAWQRDLLARLDALLMPLVPRSMRTIWYGAALKG